jgi:hypothetical protein
MAFFALETARKMSLSSRPSPGRSAKRGNVNPTALRNTGIVEIRSLDPGLRRDDDLGVA